MNKLSSFLVDPFVVNNELELLPSESEILEFISTDRFSNMLSELTNTVNVGGVSAVDDGPNYHYSNHSVYKRVSKERAEKIGWSVVNYVLSGGKDGENPNAPIYPNGPVGSVSFFPAGIAGIKTSTNQQDLVGSEAWNKWFAHVTRKAAMVGYELVRGRDQRIRDAADKKQSMAQSHADMKDERDHDKGGLNEVIRLTNSWPVSMFNNMVEKQTPMVCEYYKIHEDDRVPVASNKIQNMKRFLESGFIFNNDMGESDKAVCSDLYQFVCTKLSIKKLPPIKLTNDREDIDTTAYYNTLTNEIKVYTKNRALADILRSIAHELVHHKQNEDSRLYNVSGSKWAIDDTDPLETEAHALAGDLITKFKKITEVDIYINEITGKTYPYNCLMFKCEFNNWGSITSIVDENDVYTRDGFGVEDDPHVTVLYGIHDHISFDDILPLIDVKTPVQLNINGISYFENEQYDVLKFDVESEQLSKMNSVLRKNVEYTNSYNGYDPHITIAYLKPGTGKKYIHDFKSPKVMTLDSMVFSTTTGEKSIRKLSEGIEIDVSVGDTILTGKFKNKKTVVKDIGKDEHGMPTINGRKIVTFRKYNEDPVNEIISSTALKSIEKFADAVLSPLDVEFTRHFFDRLNDPRNEKPITSSELISFFKRLASKKDHLIQFLKKYREMVASDSNTDINIPFVNKVDTILAKTIMRKHGFRTPDAKLTINQ